MRPKPVAWDISHHWNDGWASYTLEYAYFTEDVPQAIAPAGWEKDEYYHARAYGGRYACRYRRKREYGFRPPPGTPAPDGKMFY